MTEPTSPAIRIAKIYNDLSRKALSADGQLTFQIWSSVLECRGLDTDDLSTVEQIMLIRQEIEGLKAALSQQPTIKPHRFDTAIGAAHSCTEVQRFHHNKDAITSVLTHEVLMLLDICTDLIPADGETVPQETLEEIYAAVSDLQQELQNLTDPASDLRQFISAQLLVIKRALRNYRIIGRRAFANAVAETLPVVAEYRETIVEETKKDSRTANAFRRVIEGVKKAAVDPETIGTAIQTAIKLLTA